MCFLLAFIWFRVQVAASPPFLLGDARKWHLSHQSLVTSHSYDTREGIVSHAWYEILRLSPHLFWLGFFSHRAFPPLRMMIREGGRVFIWEIRCVFWNYRCYIRYE